MSRDIVHARARRVRLSRKFAVGRDEPEMQVVVKTGTLAAVSIDAGKTEPSRSRSDETPVPAAIRHYVDVPHERNRLAE
ncbi:MAG: hypothetical protein QOJ62_1787 [Actinomycetota bacterium]|jgi:hypothetical protein|nr:hypothetical protein [Actinomycetota bacterium]